MRNRHRRGFSIVELCVVLTLVGVLGAVLACGDGASGDTAPPTNPILDAMQGAKSKLDAMALSDLSEQLWLAFTEPSTARVVSNLNDNPTAPVAVKRGDVSFYGKFPFAHVVPE